MVHSQGQKVIPQRQEFHSIHIRILIQKAWICPFLYFKESPVNFPTFFLNTLLCQIVKTQMKCHITHLIWVLPFAKKLFMEIKNEKDWKRGGCKKFRQGVRTAFYIFY